MCKFKKRVPGLCVSRGPKRKLINVINFIEQTLTTLSSYGKRLKKIKSESDPAAQVINLSTKRFWKDTFKLLNKNYYQLHKTYQ